jgi:hypothetical protein
VILLSLVSFPYNTAKAADPNLAIVIDHNCTNIAAIPQSAIEQAKASLHIAYGHTSHGSQLITGMTGLIDFANGGGKGLSLPQDIFAFNSGGTGGALDLRDTPFSGAEDLGNPDRDDWEAATRNYLNAHPEVNVIIWSWCGQVDGTQSDINLYLSLMSGLEQDYPNVMFVYMTGHLNGTGAGGNVNLRNQQIRNYCIANNKILYDFADIESYDPDGLTNYMSLFANDNCDYDSDDNGSLDRNWAVDWKNSHTVNVDWFDCSPAHSQALNGNQKAYAAWWLWAWLGGWRGTSCLPSPTNLVADANSSQQRITLTWTDNSHDPNNEDSFIIQRQVNSESWNNNYATISAYRYRVVGHSSGSCDSSPSNVAVAVLTSQLPNAPSSLNSTVNGYTVNLTWTDNSNNEETFILERKVDSGDYAFLAGSITADTESYNDTDTAPLHTYTYRIKAHNSFGDSDYSNETSKYIYETTTTIKLQSTTEVDDAFLDSANPNTNYGSTNYVSTFHRYIVKFNFPADVLNKRIISANIAFYGWNQTNYHSGEYMDLYRVTRDWQESTVTWNIAQTGQPWTAAGGDYAELLGQVPLLEGVDHEFYPVVDVTDIVQDWVRARAPNYGILLINNALTDTGLKASEYGTSCGNCVTYLEITYTAGCSCTIPGDTNYDCTVDFYDFAQLAQNWLTGNDFSDLDILSDNWLTYCP